MPHTTLTEAADAAQLSGYDLCAHPRRLQHQKCGRAAGTADDAAPRQKDTFTYNLDSIVKTVDKTTTTMQLFLTLVAVISLVVGVGVMKHHAGQ